MDRRDAIRRTAALMGGFVSAPALTGVLSGCRAKPTLDWIPLFLSGEQGALVAEVAEIIIPRTDTPGAKDVGVPGFIDLMLKEVYDREDQVRFLAGLAVFDTASKNKYDASFVALRAEQKAEHVKTVHDAAIIIDSQAENRPFILVVKELTLLGFFTSQPGATEVLQYEPVPGAYHGCLPLKEVGKTWAT
jgi:glucoside 3-dehydrogenase (cytochrome c) hitch-hiker subunit